MRPPPRTRGEAGRTGHVAGAPTVTCAVAPEGPMPSGAPATGSAGAAGPEGAEVPPAGSRAPVARNVGWNWAGTGTSLAVGLWTVPFLIHRLGTDTYALWILIGAITDYFGFVDLAIRHSVGRYVAFHRARDDRHAIDTTVSSALAVVG